MGQKPENTLRSNRITLTMTRDLALWPNEKDIEVLLNEDTGDSDQSMLMESLEIPESWEILNKA